MTCFQCNKRRLSNWYYSGWHIGLKKENKRHYNLDQYHHTENSSCMFLWNFHKLFQTTNNFALDRTQSFQYNLMQPNSQKCSVQYIGLKMSNKQRCNFHFHHTANSPCRLHWSFHILFHLLGYSEMSSLNLNHCNMLHSDRM